MSIFRRKKKFNISERDPTYKVRYLGNVQTTMTKGDGCVDKASAILWNNYLKTANQGIEMELSICSSGLKALTKQQGLTEYRAHRISYCLAHPKFPKLFVWVYRHEGKKMKVELRCHAVLLKSEAKCKAVAVQLHDKLQSALKEFMKEKTRRQNTRLALQRTNSMPVNASGYSAVPMRTMFLTTGNNFKPSMEKSPSGSKLGAISEGFEPIEEGLEEEDEVLEVSVEQPPMPELDEELEDDEFDNLPPGAEAPDLSHLSDVNGEVANNNDIDTLADDLCGIEIGNNIEELKMDEKVRFHLIHDDASDASSESGYSEQDSKESSSTNSGNSASSAGNDSAMSTSVPLDKSNLTKGEKSQVTNSSQVDNMQVPNSATHEGAPVSNSVEVGEKSISNSTKVGALKESVSLPNGVHDKSVTANVSDDPHDKRIVVVL